MSTLTIQRLEIFRAVYENGSLTQAASELKLAQPTVSKHISNFQRTLGFDLFVNEKGRLRPTVEADALYHECKGMFDQLEHVDQSVQSLRRGSEQILRIMIIAPGAQLRLVSDAIRALRDRWPDVNLLISVGDRDTQVRKLRRGEIDLGIGTPKLPHPDIESEVLCTLRMVGILPLNHELAAQRKLPLSAFGEYSSILPSETTLYGKLILRTLEHMGIVPDTRISATTPTQLPLLADSLGCLSILDMITAFHPPKDAAIKVLPLDISMDYNVCVNRIQGRVLSPQTKFLIAKLREGLTQEKHRMERQF
ncbi:LysR family transcriptional regulator [Pseudovibrio ascidiaceicola]|uniref:LysR family transcriptional regulator n=1 Tax=Pseudovibrio ascidiaceicola TaxID=285279 RepID=UPI000D6924D2|nr:LysR family transcriptional regulator [Pseudovibrio ascidiaceicola]